MLQNFQSDSSQISFNAPYSGSVIRPVQLRLADRIDVKDFGATGDGATDDTAALNVAYAVAAVAGKTAWHPDGTYHTTGLTANCAIDMSPMAQLFYVGSQNGTVINLAASNLKHGTVRAWGNSSDVLGIDVTGGGNEIQLLQSGGITASATSTLGIVGIAVTGVGNTVWESRVMNMTNTGQANASFPQGLLVNGDKTILGDVVITDAVAGLVINTTVTCAVNRATCRNMAANGVYQLSGYLRMGSLEYEGVEQPIVFEGSSDVGRISVIGAALGVGFQNCGQVSIGQIDLQPDSAGNTPLYLFHTRAGSTSCGKIDIGRVTGKYKGTSLLAMNVGTVDYMTIGGMNVQFLYDASICTSPGSFADFSGCKGFRWENTLVEIIDVNNVLTSATTFGVTAPTTNLAKYSYIHSNDYKVYESDGVTISGGWIRGINFAQLLIEHKNVYWRTDIGPYIIGAGPGSGPMDSANAIPTAGTWARGKILWNSFPSAGGAPGWQNTDQTVVGGVWKAFANIAT